MAGGGRPDQRRVSLILTARDFAAITLLPTSLARDCHSVFSRDLSFGFKVASELVYCVPSTGATDEPGARHITQFT